METPKSQRRSYRKNMFILGHGNSFESFLENMFSKKGEDDKAYAPLEKCLRSYIRYYVQREGKTGSRNREEFESIFSRFYEYCEPEWFNHPPMTLGEKSQKLIEFINEIFPSGPREDGSVVLGISEWYTQTLRECEKTKKEGAYTPPSRMPYSLKTSAQVPEFADAFFSHISSLEQVVQESLLPDPLGYYAEKGIGEYCALYWADALGWVLYSFMEWQYQCEAKRKEYWETAKNELNSLFTVWRESSVDEDLKRKILLAYLNGRFHTPLDKWFSVVYKKWKDSKNV